MTKPSTRRRNKLAESDKTRVSALARRTVKPIALTGLPTGKYRVLLPRDLDALRIDERYQRLKITSWVNVLIQALLSGGEIPSPLTISKRPSGEMFIVDGQQRYWACVETKHSTPAMIYELGDDYLEMEKKLFLVLNDKKAVGAEYIVHAWPGEIGEMLRKADSAPAHPMFGKINFSNNSSRTFSASVLVRAICAAISPNESVPTGNVHAILSTADTWLQRPGASPRADMLLRVLAAVFEGSRVRQHIVVSFGIVANKRWRQNVDALTATEVTSLRRVNWQTIVPTAEAKFRGIVIDAIQKRWKA